jgi:hypothetical protein
LANHRGWETVTWPSWEQLPSSLLQEFQNQRANRKQSSALYDELPQTNPNLLWYTAFYRYAWTQYKNVKFSTTSLGSTSSQVEPYIIQDNVSEAKNRFLKNLEINTKEVKQLASSLEQQFLKNWATVKLLDTDYKKTFENIKELLEWNSIILDSWQKISIDINWVFYLLGECCNESIGIDIKKIIITSLKDDIVLPWKYITEGTPDKVYAYETQINGGSLSVSSEVNSKEYKAWITHHQTREQKPGEIVESWETKEPTPANPENNNIWGETTEPGTYWSWDTEEEWTWWNSE